MLLLWKLFWSDYSKNVSALQQNLWWELSWFDGRHENCLQKILPSYTNTFTCVTTKSCLQLICARRMLPWWKRQYLVVQQVWAIWWISVDVETARSHSVLIGLDWSFCLTWMYVMIKWSLCLDLQSVVSSLTCHQCQTKKNAGFLSQQIKSSRWVAASVVQDRLISTQNTALLGPAAMQMLVLSMVLNLTLLRYNRESLTVLPSNPIYISFTLFYQSNLHQFLLFSRFIAKMLGLINNAKRDVC